MLQICNTAVNMHAVLMYTKDKCVIKNKYYSTIPIKSLRI